MLYMYIIKVRYFRQLLSSVHVYSVKPIRKQSTEFAWVYRWEFP